MSYTELQAALKDLRDNHGVKLQTPLAGKGVTKATLQAEYDRVTATNVETPSEVVTTVLESVKPVLTLVTSHVVHSFKAMVPVRRQYKANGFRTLDQLTPSEWIAKELAFLDRPLKVA